MANERAVLTVSQLNEYVKMLIDSSPVLSRVWLKGEISNFTHHSSGHLYFSVKDEKSRISAVMFNRDAQNLRFRPENGMRVIIQCRVSVFPRDGVYQIYVQSIEPDGVGALYIAYEQLKKRLEAEGLFDVRYKKPLPKVPTSVGIITSPTGAAVRDIINVSTRRFPLARLVLFPALVQGDGAAATLIEGLRVFNTSHPVDVIIIGRGGGSIEDLWAFNSEELAREIRRSKIPVISAVGHETDFTICDFASDLRAPTPSAGAELALPDALDIKRKLGNVTEHMTGSLTKEIKYLRQRLTALSSSRVLSSPTVYLDERRLLLDSLSKELSRNMDLLVTGKEHGFKRLSALLEALSPLKVISKGYSAVFKDNGVLVRSVKDLNVNDRVTFKTTDGTVGAVVKEIVLDKEK